VIGHQVDIAAMPTIATAGAAFGAVRLTAEGNTATPAMASTSIDFDLIDKHGRKKKKARQAPRLMIATCKS